MKKTPIKGKAVGMDSPKNWRGDTKGLTFKQFKGTLATKTAKNSFGSKAY